MTSVGAYSIKFQNLEQEHLKQLRERERMKREKARFYSKQTAQRQKALEEKKKAMAIAEDDRRRKALTDRKESQKQATNRFKSALSRIKGSTKGQGQSKDTNTAIEFYLPGKANPYKRANTSSQSQANKPTEDDQSKRIVLGKEVEVDKPNTDYHLYDDGLQNRTSSLDDVLRQIQGEGSTAPNGGFPFSQGKIHFHQRIPTILSATQENKQLGSLGGPGRSASDPSLTVTGNNHREKQNTHPSMQLSHHNSVKEKTFIDSRILSSNATYNLRHDTHSEFQTEDPQPTQPPDQSVSKMVENIPVLSPDSSSNGLPSDSSSDEVLSPDLDDSLESSDPAVTFTVGGKRPHPICNKTDQSRTDREKVFSTNESVINDTSHSNSNSFKPRAPDSQGSKDQAKSHLGHQPILYVCEVEDSSSNGSMEEYDVRPGPTPKISQVRKQNKTENKRHPNQPENPNSIPIATMSNGLVHSSSEPWNVKQQTQYSMTDDKNGTESAGKVVGILKKSDSVVSSVTHSVSDTSCITRGQGVEIAVDAGQHHCDGRIAIKKKVRFFDQVRSKNSGIPVMKNSTRSENGFVDSARIELWKRVLPNGLSTHYLPNSAFTPKMKVSLTSKPSESQAISGPPLKPPPSGITFPVSVPGNESPDQFSACNHSQAEITNIPTSVTPSVNERRNSTSNTTLKPEESLSGSLNPSNKQLPVTTHSFGSNGSSKLQESGQVALDKTPTDDDIDNLWNQIRSNLQDNRKVSIPPQVFNFRIQPDSLPYESSLSVEQQGRLGPNSSEISQRSLSAERTNSKSGDVAMPQRQVLTRQAKPARPLRCEKPHQQTLLLERRGPSYVTTYPSASRQNHSVFLTRTHPNVQTFSKEPEISSKTTANNFGRIPTALSMEEQRLMSSIQALDRKIKDHMTRGSRGSSESPDFTPEFYPYPPSSPTPPLRHRPVFKHPQNHAYGSSIGGQSKGYGNLQKPRTQSTPFNTQIAGSSVSHNGRALHRQPLY